MITYNYRIYKGDDVIFFGGDIRAKSIRSMKQAITNKIGESNVQDCIWYEGSDDEFLRGNKIYTLYAHVTDFNEPPPRLPRYSNGEWDVWQ